MRGTGGEVNAEIRFPWNIRAWQIRKIYDESKDCYKCAKLSAISVYSLMTT